MSSVAPLALKPRPGSGVVVVGGVLVLVPAIGALVSSGVLVLVPAIGVLVPAIDVLVGRGVLVLVPALDVLVGGPLQVALSAALDVPVGHARHAAAEVAPIRGAYVPFGHTKQVVAPAVLDHVPAPHAAHCDDTEPSSALYVPAPHAVQLCARAPLVVPAGHASHCEFPRNQTIFPGAQSEQ